MNFNTDSQHLYYFVAAATTIIGLVYKLGSKAYNSIKKELTSLQEDRERLRIVFKELTPNHGSSLKDKVNCLEAAVNKNNELTQAIFFRQRWVMESQTAPIFEAGKDGLFTWVNEEFAHLFGKSATQFLGNGWKNVVFNEDREKVEQRWNHCVEQKINCEIQFRIWVNDRAIPVKMVAQRTDAGYIGSLVLLKK